ncbi:alpha/beta fold hydrolase [Georgenia sp. 311]|uniref:alpha/beta fold hydrolase n=1 Tax=Georgenia sp. 311 TaxID=2585134 RepID=UPI001111C0B4|nr:alpha/beta fold hydrolase [Georgenia sp. 311]TNC17277.1 alpha/beta fold hydrolase [Georgenia sp. 311]
MSGEPGGAAGRTTGPSGGLRLAALRGGFGALDRVAPEVGARWAVRIWCTVPRGGGLRRDERPGEGERSTVAVAPGRDVVVETWGSGEPVYLVHGWGGWRGQLGAFVAPLVAQGRRVVAFDAPSHGESAPGFLGPRRSTALEMVDALKAVTAAHGTPAAVVAHSLGATVTTIAVTDGVAAGRLALLAPSAEVLSMTRTMARHLGYGERTRSRFDRRLEALARRPLRDFDLTAHDVTVPVLVVHDRQDKEVPHADGVRVAGTWPDGTLVTTEGLGHRRLLRDPGVVDVVTRFVAASDGAQGSSPAR